MKLRVVGWQSYNTNRECGEKTWAVRNAIIDGIRKHGYQFSGWSHQELSDCTPVLNDGKKYCYSQRGWGDVMAEAHGLTGPMDYCRFAFQGDYDEEIRPKDEDNEFYFPYIPFEDEEEEEALDLSEFGIDDFEFTDSLGRRAFKPETDLNERIEIEVSREVFDAAKSGEIKVDVLQALRYLGEGDTLALVCGESKAEYTVKDVERKRDLTEEEALRLRMEMFHSDDREKFKQAEAQFINTKMVLLIQLEKSAKK